MTRIGHADVGFFLQTYAHVIKNDDRDAAELAASFLIGDDLETPDQKMSHANVHKSVHKPHESGPRRTLRGPFYLVAGTVCDFTTSLTDVSRHS